MLIADGTVREGAFLAGLVAIVLGAIFPPLAVPVLAIILLSLVLRGDVGTKALSWLGGLGSAPSGPPTPAVPLGPQAYMPNSQPRSA